ncbi:hypothetical protein BJF78_20655 [Pseudonocardia sp. CNS-139]|nr:hypothetical protein BJF78_20655 [Pseudonocardia sp. CNS-139]
METTAEEPVTVRLPAGWLWLVVVLGAGLGCGAGFAVAPLVGWLVELVGGAPGPLRLAAALPTVWAVPVLTLAGAAGGAWVASVWRRESPAVTIGPDHVLVHQDGAGTHVDQGQVGAAFTDGHDLVLLDHTGGELLRTPGSDLTTDRLRDAFTRFGYPWQGTADPREAEFVTWVDRSPGLDEPAHALLRTRRRALADKRTGAAEEALDGLRALGIAVRDRSGAQQYRKR